MLREPLSPAFKYGLITGRFGEVVGDGTDTGRDPEFRPFAGLSITFTLSAGKLRGYQDKLNFIQSKGIECATDVDGHLVDPEGVRGVHLVATDLPATVLNPTDSTYLVEIRRDGMLLDSFGIKVPSNSEQDLARIAPIPASNGIPIVVGPPGASGEAAWAIRKELTIPASGVVTELGSHNVWTIPQPTVLILPDRLPGATHVIHVVEGFQNLSWPNGVEVFGMNDQDSAWVQLVREEVGWSVLVGSGTGGGGVSQPVTNHFPHPILTSQSSLVTDLLNAPITNFTGPGGTAVPLFDEGNANSMPNIKFALSVTPGRKYQFRVSFAALGPHPASTVHYVATSTTPTIPEVQYGSILTIPMIETALLNLNKWYRTPPLVFTPAAGVTSIEVTLTIRAKIAWNYPTLIDVTDEPQIKHPFNPEVDSEAIWLGTPNNSKSVLKSLRPIDTEWLTQKAAGRFFGEGPPALNPEFAKPIGLRAGDQYEDTRVGQDNLGAYVLTHPTVNSTGTWRRPYESIAVKTLMQILSFGGNSMPIVSNFATPADWGTAPTAQAIEIKVEKKGGRTVLILSNIMAKVANPAGVMFNLPAPYRPEYSMSFPIALETGAMAVLKVNLNGDITVGGTVPINSVLGISGLSAAAAFSVVVNW